MRTGRIPALSYAGGAETAVEPRSGAAGRTGGSAPPPGLADPRRRARTGSAVAVETAAHPVPAQGGPAGVDGPRPGEPALLRIGDAAAAAGTTPRALRFYEQRGLLPAPGRTASGQRQYGPGDVARVRLIRDLLAAGFTVADLRGLAPRLHQLVDRPAPRCVPEPGGVVARRLAALDAEIDRLTQLRERLTLRLAGQPSGSDA